MTNLRGKILSLLVLLALLGVGIATWIHINTSLDARREELNDRANDVAEFIGLTFSESLLKDAPVPHEKRQLMKAWLDSKDHIEFFSVYNTSGKHIFSYRTNDQDPPDSPRIKSKFFRKILNSNTPSVARELQKPQVYDFLVPVQLFEIQFGLIRLGFNSERFYSDRNQIIQQNAIFGLLVILAVVILGWIVTNFLVNPLKHLESVARQFGSGDYSARAKINSGDEIQKLSDQFNEMADQIEQQIDDLKTIEKLNRKISARLRSDKLYDRIVNLINNTWNIPYIALIQNNTRDDSLDIAAGINVADNILKGLEKTEIKIEEISLGSAETSTGKKDFSPDEIDYLEGLFETKKREPLSDALVFVLEREKAQDPIGYLILGISSGSFSQSQANLLQTLTHQIKIAVQNANNYERAVTDDLTGLYTRSFFEMELQEEVKEAKNNGTSLCLAMIDLDDFKEYNDTYGHPAGDEVLQKVTQIFRSEVRTSDLKEASRNTDTLARYGGEEFSIILPDTDIKGAKSVCQRIVNEVASVNEFHQQVTISMGIAKLRNGENKDDLIQRADDNLYRAKNEGKNRVYTNNNQESTA